MGEETNIIKELVQVTSPDALQNYLSRILSTGFYEDEQSKDGGGVHANAQPKVKRFDVRVFGRTKSPVIQQQGENAQQSHGRVVTGLNPIPD